MQTHMRRPKARPTPVTLPRMHVQGNNVVFCQERRLISKKRGCIIPYTNGGFKYIREAADALYIRVERSMNDGYPWMHVQCTWP